jgi:spore maturation protein CgeB
LLVNALKNPVRWPLLPLELARLFREPRTGQPRPAITAIKAGGVDLPAFPVPRVNAATRPAVAAILDTFSRYCWRYEGNWILVTRRRWKEQFGELKPDLFFMESAWEGNDGDWTTFRSRQSRALLAELVDHSRRQGIPAVFWNKEDPPSFDRFIDTALLFDHIFTTDANCIPRYLARRPRGQVHALPFAAQPAIHNPMRPPDLPQYPVCFAGTWYAEKYPNRAHALKVLLNPALAHGLHIFDRRAAEGKEKFGYPAAYHPAIQGALSYEQMLTAYRAYRVMLNVNSVADSPTMFSRRVFEALACGTPVISSPSTGMEAMLGSCVRISSSEKETQQHLEELLGNPVRRDREGHLGYRLVHREHTYGQRLRSVLERIGGEAPGSAAWPKISVILSSHRPQNIEQALRQVASQTYPNRELILVLNQSGFDLSAVRAMTAGLGQVRVIQLDESHTLGECLNAGVDLATGGYVAKMDDDDLYGAEYLWDLMLAARFSQADVTGKGVYFAYAQGADRMGLRTVTREHGWVERGLAGGTLLVRRDVFGRVRFQPLPRGTDTCFLRDCEREGFSFYSADRFNYLMIRQADPARHTWQIDDREVLRLCGEIQVGMDIRRAMI